MSPRRLATLLGAALTAVSAAAAAQVDAGSQDATAPYTPAIPACCAPLTSASDLQACVDRAQPSNYSPPMGGCSAMPATQLAGVADIVTKFGQVDLSMPCDSHDACYGTCGNEQAQCDEAFRTQLYNQCIASQTGAGGPVSPLVLSECFVMANLLFQASTQYGSASFTSAQLASCYCCDDCGDGGPVHPTGGMDASKAPPACVPIYDGGNADVTSYDTISFWPCLESQCGTAIQACVGDCACDNALLNSLQCTKKNVGGPQYCFESLQGGLSNVSLTDTNAASVLNCFLNRIAVCGDAG